MPPLMWIPAPRISLEITTGQHEYSWRRIESYHVQLGIRYRLFPKQLEELQSAVPLFVFALAEP